MHQFALLKNEDFDPRAVYLYDLKAHLVKGRGQ